MTLSFPVNSFSEVGGVAIEAWNVLLFFLLFWVQWGWWCSNRSLKWALFFLLFWNANFFSYGLLCLLISSIPLFLISLSSIIHVFFFVEAQYAIKTSSFPTSSSSSSDFLYHVLVLYIYIYIFFFGGGGGGRNYFRLICRTPYLFQLVSLNLCCMKIWGCLPMAPLRFWT